ncbi:MAG: radical SAM protein, partial [Oscillospiraceae bacterium]
MEQKRTFKESARALAVREVLKYVEKDPEKNLPKLFDWFIEHDTGNGVTREVRDIAKAFSDPDNNWRHLILNIFRDVNYDEINHLIEAAVVNGSMIGSPRQKEMKKKYNCNVPWCILMDPTSACNLHCTGCWAAEYGKKMNLTLEELDSVIQQGEELGIYIYLYSGGEPLVRKKDLITLCERHPE